MPTVQLFFPHKNIQLSSRNGLKQFIASIFKMERKQLGNLTYIFCSDEYLLQMNRDHLNHDYYTDIITFDLSDGNGLIQGEIYISTDRVRDNASQLSTSINNELHRVIFHGVLHLCGYKDKTKADAILMRSKEDQYLNLYFK
jgi:probable rRNA maturation factor